MEATGRNAARWGTLGKYSYAWITLAFFSVPSSKENGDGLEARIDELFRRQLGDEAEARIAEIDRDYLRHA